jgi:hypothetical protein
MDHVGWFRLVNNIAAHSSLMEDKRVITGGFQGTLRRVQRQTSDQSGFIILGE